MKNKGFIYTLIAIIGIGAAITAGTSQAIDKSRAQNSVEVLTEAVAAMQEPETEMALARAADTVRTVSEPEAVAAGTGNQLEEATAEEIAPAERTEEMLDAVVAESAEVVPMSPLEPATLQGSPQNTDLEEAAVKEAAEVGSSYRSHFQELDLQIQKSREKQSASNNYSAKKQAENELKLWDNELNAVYRDIMERLDEAKAASLVEEERAWMKERDRLAAEAAEASAGGSMESVEYTLSLAESTRARAYELVELYADLLSE